ncbi:MAG: hypothetical protein EP319_11915 [Deltaproteobacteria bacterium]|nr:MAG: hypothetical protein EP319_11915 [Deltaproteobacteria bacterium]
MFYLDPAVKQLVDATGNVPNERQHEIAYCIQAAEAMIQRILGCTVVIRGKKFIFSNLELYYGGIGDEAHDWHRSTFNPKQGISKTQIFAQLNQGLRFYLRQKGKGGFNRMDLVVGLEGVAISFLIRNVHDENHQSVSKDDSGNPALLIREDRMNILDSDHDTAFEDHSEIEFIDTHDQYVKSLDQISRKKRFDANKKSGPEKGYSGFDDGPFGQHEWNFRLML